MHNLVRTSVALLALCSALPAAAQEMAVRQSHDAIARGDWSTAERTLVAEQRIYPSNTEVLLNLAAVYARTNREGQAASLYRRVLAGDDVLMDLGNARTLSAHRIAETGLRRISYSVTAAR